MKDSLHRLTLALRAAAHDNEQRAEWPEVAIDAYRSIGGFKWGVPESAGGEDRPTAERLAGYIALARGDMSTALYITQHESAVDLVVRSNNEPLRDAWLGRFAAGEVLATIGYSQLTTSRQGGKPAMAATPVDGGYRFDGVMPWVTGAPYVDVITCGATLPDGEQLIGLVPTRGPGVTVAPAAPLAALNSTHTAEVTCEQFFLPQAAVVRGPMPNVLGERIPVRVLLVNATGVGLAYGMLDQWVESAAQNPPLKVDGGWEPRLAQAEARCAELRDAVLKLAGGDLAPEPIEALRARVNAWLVSLAGLLMVGAKGSGYYLTHPAQRLAREAMFFCVWSASDAIRGQTIDALLSNN